MNENQFDEFFRKKLGDYSSPVSEDMWQRIKPKKDKDRRFLLFLLFALLITGGTTAYFILGSKGNEASKNIASIKTHSIKDSENKFSNQQDKHESIVTRQNSTNQQKENQNSGTNQTSVLNTYSVNSTLASAAKSKPAKTKDSRAREKPRVNNNFTNQQQANSQIPATDVVSQKEANNTSDLSNNKPEESVTTNVPLVNQNAEKKSLLQKDSSSKPSVSTLAGKKEKNDHNPIIDNLFLEMFVSPDVPVSQISSSNPTYLQHKDSTSNMQLSYTVGLKIGALFGEHFLVKTGVQYSHINEKFNYLNNTATRVIPVTVQRTVTDANGNARTFLDTSDLIQVGKDYKLTYNQYKSFDIPLIIGYETAGDRFKAAVNTGVILNVKTNYKGDILDASLNPVDINSANAYKSNTGVSLYIGLGLSTKLNNSWQLFTEPYIKYHLSNMTGPYQAFTQKINVGGLSLGLKYNFIK